MDQPCSVCGSSAGTRHLCQVCNKPCHTKCSRKKIGRCDNCRVKLSTKIVEPSVKKTRMSGSSQNRASYVLPRIASTRAPSSQKSALSPSAEKQQRLPASRSSPGALSPRTQPEPKLAPEHAADTTDSSSQTDLEDADLSSFSGIIKNVIIPESTLDLFFQHFNTLQASLEGIEAKLSGLDLSFGSAPQCPKTRLVGLGDRIAALEGLVAVQSSQLDDLRLDRRHLLVIEK